MPLATTSPPIRTTVPPSPFEFDFGKQYIPFGCFRPAGGLLLKNKNIPVLGCCPAGGLDLKKSHFLYLFNVLQVAKLFYFDGFEHREYAKLLSFEKCFKMH